MTSDYDFKIKQISSNSEIKQVYSDPKFRKIMIKMGYQEEKGLRKNLQGIKEPIMTTPKNDSHGIAYQQVFFLTQAIDTSSPK